MKPQVAVQRTTYATALEENYRRTPTVLGHQLVDLLRAATVPTTLVVVAVLQLMVMLATEAAAAGPPHTWLAGEPVAEAIAEAEATQTATSLVPHAAATTLAAELKRYDARSPAKDNSKKTSDGFKDLLKEKCPWHLEGNHTTEQCYQLRRVLVAEFSLSLRVRMTLRGWEFSGFFLKHTTMPCPPKGVGDTYL
jgi:hypothetical protein